VTRNTTLASANPFCRHALCYADGCVAKSFPIVRPPLVERETRKKGSGAKEGKARANLGASPVSMLRGGLTNPSLRLCPSLLPTGRAACDAQRSCASSFESTS
jgi:hypothetical protein